MRDGFSFAKKECVCDHYTNKNRFRSNQTYQFMFRLPMHTTIGTLDFGRPQLLMAVFPRNSFVGVGAEASSDTIPRGLGPGLVCAGISKRFFDFKLQPFVVYAYTTSGVVLRFSLYIQHVW